MDEKPENQRNQGESARQPILLLPPVITVMLGVLVAIQLASSVVLNDAGVLRLDEWFAFVPSRVVYPDSIEGGAWPIIWTPITYTLLHQGWEHLLLNAAWLAIFGTPVARRYGTVPTLLMFFISAIAGAALFAVTVFPGPGYLIGASGGIAGLTGAACRFMFQPVITAEDPETGRVIVLGRKTATLRELVRDRRAMLFIGVWVILNAAVPFAPTLLGGDGTISWQAHLGGFFAGLLLVPLFEKRPKETVT
jgi:membrane associated rhomboid family serine protease